MPPALIISLEKAGNQTYGLTTIRNGTDVYVIRCKEKTRERGQINIIETEDLASQILDYLTQTINN